MISAVHPLGRPAAPRRARSAPARTLVIVAAAAAALALAGCGSKKDKAASQTAAKVDKQEITVHQINYVLQQQRGLRPEQADAASRQILERLIDQQLALEKADGLKLDRDPRVVQQLEAARRDILARAYAEKVGEGAAKPSAEEIKKYYDDNPALFSQRRIYTLQELAVEARPEQYQMLRDRLGASKNINEFIEFLKAGGLRFAGNQAVRPAEQLPLNALKALAQLKDGQAIVNTTPNGLQVLVLAGSTTQPVSEEQARPAIEAFLLNERRARLLQDDLKALRAAARIEYVGKFAEGPHPGASAPAADAPGAAAQPAAPAAPAASSGLTDTDITKGMGLKK
ncbi:MAG: hypothetical protein AMXMBFR66_24170 [Pseudomonadota bacterium]